MGLLGVIIILIGLAIFEDSFIMQRYIHHAMKIITFRDKYEKGKFISIEDCQRLEKKYEKFWNLKNKESFLQWVGISKHEKRYNEYIQKIMSELRTEIGYERM